MSAMFGLATLGTIYILMNLRAIFQSPLGGLNLDLLSLLIGFVAAILLIVGLRWLWPKLVKAWQRLGRSFNSRKDELQTGTEKRFMNETVESVQRHHLGSGLASLETIFIFPRISIPNPNSEEIYASRMEAGQMHYLWPGLAACVALPPPPSVSVRQLLLGGKRVILSGDPGVGKSTLLAYCAYLCASSSTEPDYTFLESKLPVFVHVIELGLFAGSDETKMDLEETPIEPILRALMGKNWGISDRKLRTLIQSKAEQGQLLLLLDGWDELPAPDRPVIASWLSDLLEVYPDIQSIVASPTRGFGPLLELDFLVTGVMAWRIGQAEDLGLRWSTVTNREDQLPLDLYWQPGYSSFESSTRAILLASTEEISRSESPILRKVDLLETALLRMMRKIKLDSSEEWLVPAARELWQEVAYRMLEGRRISLQKSEVLALAESILQAYDVLNSSKATKQLFSTLANSELFVDYSGEQVSFLSPLWRDYLAASFLAQAHSGIKVTDFLGDPFWYGALKFYAGRVGATNLLKEIQQEDGSVLDNDLFLLAEWLPESLDRQQWRRTILIGLGRIVIDQDTPVFWRQRATIALAVTGEQGVSALLNQLLSQSEPMMRQIALATIARVASREAILLNERMSGDGDERVRVAAIHALAWMDSSITEQPLLRALIEPDELVSKAAAEGLALNGTAESRQILSEAILDDSMSVRRAAVHGLALLDEAWANELLEEVAQVDNQRFIQSAAGRAVQSRRMGIDGSEWKEPRAGEQEWLINWAVSRGRVVPVGPGAIPLIIEALADGDETIRVSAANTLARLMAVEAVEPLKIALDDPDANVRAFAFYALCLIDRAWANDAIPTVQA